jgi:hypothetical protein
METVERVVGRLPRFYKSWDQQSNFFRVLESFAKIDDEQRKDLFSIMRSHWIDTAYGIDLDYLGSVFKLKRRPTELDESFRRRIKFFIAEFTGGGTRESIIAQTVLYLDMKEEYPELIENPPVQQRFERKVKYGHSWVMRSNSVNLTEEARITLVLELGESGQSVEVRNPTLRDLGAKSSIKFKGILRSGQKLVIKADGSGELDGADIGDDLIIENDGLKILRKGSTWVFEEEVSPNIGRFDQGAFDERVFDMFVPAMRLDIEWTARLLASFELKVSANAVQAAGISKDDLEELVNAIKAIGVKAFVTVESVYNDIGREQDIFEPVTRSKEKTEEPLVIDSAQTIVDVEQHLY